MSGLERIHRTEVISEILSTETMMPPTGAGILALQCREGDTAVIAGMINPKITPRRQPT